MSALVALAAALGVALSGPPASPATLPREVVVAGLRGETRIAVRRDGNGSPVVPASPLAAALDGMIRVEAGWAEVTIARQPFRFLIGAPLYQFSNQLLPLARHPLAKIVELGGKPEILVPLLIELLLER